MAVGRVTGDDIPSDEVIVILLDGLLTHLLIGSGALKLGQDSYRMSLLEVQLDVAVMSDDDGIAAAWDQARLVRFRT